MFPNLSYISNYFFGTPVDNGLSFIQTFGLFLVLAFSAAYFVFKNELKWREKEGMLSGVRFLGSSPKPIPISILVLNFVIGFLAGSKLPLILNRNATESVYDLLFSFQFDITGGVIGAIFLGGAGLYFFLNQKEVHQRDKEGVAYPSDYAIELVILAAITGLIGAKLFSVAENLEAFYKSPIETLFSGSGLTIYGGLIVGFGCGYLYMKRKGFKVFPIMDAISPSLLIGYMIGRMGCHFSGDGDWGKVNMMPKPDWFVFPDWLWTWHYPHNVVNSSLESIPIPDCGGLVSATGQMPIYCKMLPEGVYPTPLYEIIICGIFLIVIFILRKKIKISGLLFFLYLTLTGIERFLIEFIRVNERYDLFGLSWSFSQWIALIMSFTGIIGMYLLYKRTKQ